MISYRLAEARDMAQIAETHIECFPGYFITSLGRKLIQNYYHTFWRENNLFVVAEDKEEIIGFCMGYINGSNARSIFINENLYRLIWRLFGLCMTFNLLTIKKCFNIKNLNLKTSKHINKQVAAGNLLSICVKQEYRGFGVSKALVQNFENLLREKNLEDYTLSVYVTNEEAIRFYTKSGMTIIATMDGEHKFYKKLLQEDHYDHN